MKGEEPMLEVTSQLNLWREGLRSIRRSMMMMLRANDTLLQENTLREYYEYVYLESTLSIEKFLYGYSPDRIIITMKRHRRRTAHDHVL